MAEQFIKAFKVDREKLDAVVRCKDEKLLAKLLESDLADEVAERCSTRSTRSSRMSSGRSISAARGRVVVGAVA